MTSISFTHVAKNFGKVQVIRDVDLDIAPGEFCVFLGPSGCGKSTLLRMIAGLEAASAGEIRIDGRLVNHVPPAERQVAMVFQNYALYPHMTVYENMAFGLKQTKVPKPEIKARVAEAARILQIEALMDRMPKALSGGQRQRVAIGRAIVRQPKVFLFDEPLSNLDAALRVHMRSEIASLHRKFPSASFVYVTHDQMEAMALADKIVLLHTGRTAQERGSIAQVGSPLDLYYRPKNRFVAGFLGSPTMNFLSATLVAADATGATVELTGGERITFPVDARSLEIGAQLTLGIRPEHLAPASDATAQTIVRPVEMIEHFGEFSFVYLTSGESMPLIAKVQGETAMPPDQRFRLGVPAASCHLFGPDDLALPRIAGA
ncbi:MAG: sn-glycerol-3-phosphate ABC transporter ATP-binding protein UgpC [Ancalomicrobiaceae bacterium]|nr:sn-glycerol-3-phosphate ABC transporter ATP-binding protein UgpC [Ancalomicrobiaceae bacterium]